MTFIKFWITETNHEERIKKQIKDTIISQYKPFSRCTKDIFHD